MSDINNCTFTGRLTRDAESKVLSTGTKLVTFDIANNTGWGSYAKTLYVTVNLWGKSGESVFTYLKKGKTVGVSGSLEQQEWESQRDGTLHKKLVISSNSVTLLADSKSASSPEPTYDHDYTSNDEDIQF